MTIPAGIKRAGLYVLCAIAGALLFYVLRPDAPLPEVYTRGTLILTKAELERDKPDEELGMIERATKKKVAPTVRAIAPGAEKATALEVAELVLETLQPDTSNEVEKPAQLDSAGSSESEKKGTRVLAFPTAIRFDQRKLTLWTWRTDGAAGRLEYPARGRWELVMSGDSAIVHAERFPQLREALQLAPCAAGGVAAAELGSWIPAAVGCGVSLWLGIR